MVSIGAAEFARMKGISTRRAQQLASRGQVPAERIGNQWILDSSALAAPLRGRRPLSDRSAAALTRALEGGPAAARMDSQEVSRLRKRLASLADDHAPALLRDWLSGRQVEVLSLAANPRDVPGLLADECVRVGGVSDSRSQMSSAQEAEIYVAQNDLDAVVRKWMLVPSERPNVRVHVVSEMPSDHIPIAWILADLAERGGPREEEKVRELLQWILA